MSKAKDDVVVVGDLACVQRGEHAGKIGTVAEIFYSGTVIMIEPSEGASWTRFEIALADVSISHPVPPELACWWILDESMNAHPTNDPFAFQGQWKDPRRRVGRTEVAGKTVSTVFRGTPYPSTNPSGSLDWQHPTLWETCVYDPDHQPEGESGYEIYDRYATHAEAVAGHERVVAALAITERPTS